MQVLQVLRCLKTLFGYVSYVVWLLCDATVDSEVLEDPQDIDNQTMVTDVSFAAAVYHVQYP